MLNNDTACMSNPCWSNGTCINFNDGWRCICKFGTTGNNCKILEMETFTKKSKASFIRIDYITYFVNAYISVI